MHLRLIATILIAGAASAGGLLTAQTKVIAHRGYWDADGSAQNSIASLRKAAQAGVYGSEFDVLLTQDGVPVVNHDDSIQGRHIETTPYNVIEAITLPNGETLPTLDSYLEEGRKHPQLALILEIKPHRLESNELRAAQTIVDMVERKGLRQQVEYISFSLFMCKELVRLAPQSQVAYLLGDLSPKELKQYGLTGLDYHYSVMAAHPEWISEAKEEGLSVNVWTVNAPALMDSLIRQGVDYITTDKPEELQQLIREQQLQSGL
jgi:glycerophosphoryl diester phosphodiesterase